MNRDFFIQNFLNVIGRKFYFRERRISAGITAIQDGKCVTTEKRNNGPLILTIRNRGAALGSYYRVAPICSI